VTYLSADDANDQAQAEKWAELPWETEPARPTVRPTPEERELARIAWLAENASEFLDRFPDGIDPAQGPRRQWGHWNVRQLSLPTQHNEREEAA
jgi:hypothetical protein